MIGAHVKRHDCVRSRSLPLLFLPHKDRQIAGQKIQLLASESKETQIHKFFVFFFLCTQTHKCAHADMYSSKSCWHTSRHTAESFTPSLKEKLKKKSLFILSKVKQVIMFVDDMFIYIQVSKWNIFSYFARRRQLQNRETTHKGRGLVNNHNPPTKFNKKCYLFRIVFLRYTEVCAAVAPRHFPPHYWC